MKISSSPRSYRSPQRAKRGIALVLVLAFVVILTVLALAFLSRALLNQQISVSSSSRVKVDIFAQGALKTILGDLNDEIVAGSGQGVPGAPSYTYTMSVISPLTHYNNVTVYIPNTPATVIPAVSLPTSIATGSSTFLIPNAPNLVKISQYQQPFFPNSSSSPYEGTNSAGVVVTPQPSNRACNVDTSVASLNGRSISSVTWNKALLLPKATPTSTTDFTPAANSFANPDWVLVARDGSNPTSPTFGSTTSGTVNNRAQSNSKYVVGRYAYMIYDEGGLLDANAVGRPAGTMPASTPNNQNNQVLNYQNSEAFVDLTQSPFSLSATAINNLVGWRNYASAATTGSFPSLKPCSTTSPYITAYYNNIMFNPAGVSSTNPFGFVTGFLTPAVNLVGTGTTLNNALNVASNQTDRMFTSRQQLIAFFNACDTSSSNTLSTCQNMLQYLTHFSRDLEQPLIIPRPERPKIVAAGYPAGAQNSQGNSEYPAATGRNFGNDTDNPTDPFTTVTPVIPQSYVNPDFLEVQKSFGNSVTIKRFPLNRLALLTSAATGSGADLIYKYFGLKRTASATSDTSTDAVNSIWIYDHSPGPNSEGDPQGRILTLGEVAQLNPPRDPDFFEMLKGAISVGSIGRSAAPGFASTISQSEVLLDNDVDYQILQIGANLIDQYKADNIPTRITQSSNISGGTVSSFAAVFSGDEDLPYLYRLRDIPVVTNTSTQGATNTGTLVVAPEVWNPHMQNSNDSSMASTQGPVKFRIWMATPGNSSVFTQSDLKDSKTPPNGPNYTTVLSTNISWPNGTDPDTSSNGNDVLNFQSNGVSTAYFRQPTLLLNYSSFANGNPYKITPSGPNVPVKDVNNVTLAGFTYGSCTWAYNYQSDYYQASNIWPQTTNGIIVHLDYFNPSTSQWIEYQNIYTDTGGNNDDIGSYGRYVNYTNYSYCDSVLYDPRTTRWNMVGGNNPSWYMTQSATGFANTFVTQQDGTSNPGGSGLWLYDPQSTPFYTSYNDPLGGAEYLGSFQQNLFSNGHLDADGVCRPAMGLLQILSPSSTTGLPMAGPPQPPTSNPPTGWTSRPVILHRPFRSVAEMAYAFSGTPWTNIDFTNPSSGSANLLEAFCLNESDRADGMVAGRVNLNTRQQPVLAALFNGAYVDEFGTISPIASAAAQSLAATLISRTESTSLTTGLGPLESRAELVGRMVNNPNFPSTTSFNATPITSTSQTQPTYSGFVNDARTPSGAGLNPTLDVSSALSANNIPNINRWRESAIRGLADVGTARTWNLMIDVIAQTGQYPPNATSAANFQVEGQKRYWLHVAIDRFTGKIIDQQLEPVVQ